MSIEYLSDERYVAALERMRDRIESGERLQGYDSTEIGHKCNEVTWGLCYEGADFWPEEDRENNLAIDSYAFNGELRKRVRVYSRADHQTCPFDKRDEPSIWGCFYHCRFYQGPRPSKKQALKLYDIRIKGAKVER